MEDPNSFLEKNKENIYRTAEFIAQGNNLKADDQFKILCNQYITKEGTGHLEQMANVDLGNVLGAIRHLPFERFCVFCISQTGEAQELWHADGTQVSSALDMQSVLLTINTFILMSGINKVFDFYFVHNHPYIYRASPSEADLEVLEEIVNIIGNIHLIQNRILNNKVRLLDFGIVTDYDYWSYNQHANTL